jgi:predicted CXXCH cytochrome family protein
MTLHRKRANRGLQGLAFACLLAMTIPAGADQDGDRSGGVPMPVIPAGQGEACVADNDFMRRNHMDMLVHQRDETVFKGLRDEAFSLKDCISCHVVRDADARAVTVSDPRHFCRSCHDYAAVSIDCFQCHASRPESIDFPRERQFSGQPDNSTDQTGSDQP